MNFTSTTPIYTFASGKGGVGKTSLCLNFATLLAKQGKRVLVFDGDFGLANADVQLGLTPQKDLSDVLRHQATLEEITLKSDKGFWLIPGRSGAQNLPFMSAIERKDLLTQLRALAQNFDIVFIDAPAGLDETVMGLCGAGDQTILVTTPDPSAITDAYALVKLLLKRHDIQNARLIINQAGSPMEGEQTANKIVTAAEKFLGIKLPVIGHVPYDRNYAASVKMQQLATQAFPNSKAAEAIQKLAQNLLA